MNLRLICAAGSEADEQRYGRWLAEAPANLHMSRTGYLPFEEYCHAVGDCHFFLDLRRIDAENTRCLPIKAVLLFGLWSPGGVLGLESHP